MSLQGRLGGRRGAVLVLLGLLCWAGTPGAQEGFRVLEAVLLPPRFFVGDRVELRLRLDVPAGRVVETPRVPGPARQPQEPARQPQEPGARQLPEPGGGGREGAGASWLRIDGIQVLDRRVAGSAGEVQVRVFFVPLEPGEGRLPELVLGELKVPEQQFLTSSVREREPEPVFRPLRGQLLPPFARLRLALTALIFLGTPALTAFGSIRFLQVLRRLRERHRRRRPAQRARSALSKLALSLEDRDTEQLFADLARILKGYLGERLDVATASATTGELEGLLGAAGVPESLSGRIREVLRIADRAKFSGRAGRKAVVKSNLDKVREIVARIEEVSDVEP